jgi:uncharacterized protein (DUF1778 family)
VSPKPTDKFDAIIVRQTMSDRIVFARMRREDVQLIKEICEARGEDLSDFVRRAIKRELARLSFLSEEEKKALGIASNRSIMAEERRI